MRKHIKIFTDGSCLGNPGQGGYAIILRYHQNEKIFSEGYYLTTNNRMEIMAVIFALKLLKEYCDVILYTDSQYVRKGVTEWIYNWKRQNWKTTKKRPVQNIDLWKKLDTMLNKHRIQWEWVKGHNGNLENERCDKLARIAALHPTKEDIGYSLFIK